MFRARAVPADSEKLMDPKWSEDLPIYRQLRDRVVEMILEGVLGDGDALPSVRNVAAEYRLNPLTVLKGYQELVDEGLVEKKRGRGMFVNDGARDQLLIDERQRFVENNEIRRTHRHWIQPGIECFRQPCVAVIEIPPGVCADRFAGQYNFC